MASARQAFLPTRELASPRGWPTRASCSWVEPAAGRYFDNTSPVNGAKLLCEIARSDAADIEAALDAAHAAKDAWGRTSVAERALILNRIADRMEDNLELLAPAETWDNGKPIRETTAADMPLAIDHFRYFAGAIRAQEGCIAEIDHDTVAYHFHEPLGVVGQIIPWNFPLLMAGWKLAPALAAGNCVVLKPAEQTPASILVLADLIGDLLPPGVLNIVNGFGLEAGKPLASSPRIAKIAFTGETTDRPADHAVRQPEPDPGHAGARRQVARTSSSPTSSPRTTTSSTRRSRASRCSRSTRARSAPARAARWSTSRSTTASWSGPSPRVEAIMQGNPLDPATMIGAQASSEQLEKILSYIDIGSQEGAEVLTGGARNDCRATSPAATTSSRRCSRATTRCASSRRRSSGRWCR